MFTYPAICRLGIDDASGAPPLKKRKKFKLGSRVRVHSLPDNHSVNEQVFKQFVV